MYKRHVLLEITPSGRERLLNSLSAEKNMDECYRTLLLPSRFIVNKANLFTPYCSSMPAIVRRKDEYTPEGNIAIAFSSWQRNEQGRIKIIGYVDDSEIIKAITPYDVTQIVLSPSGCYTSNRIIDALTDLLVQHQNDVMIGIWGSTALDLVTGYSYIHEFSDLDILLTFNHSIKTSMDKLHFLLESISAIEKKYDLRIDPEVDLANGYGISLKELCTDSKTLLGKSINDISLLSRESVYLDLAI